MAEAWSLDPRLAADTTHVRALDLCEVRLMDRPTWPWLVLVPRRAGVVELFDLSIAERAQLAEKVALAARALKQAAMADKINIGALGNIVAQLHVHVVARRMGDRAWPGPVWGVAAPERYEEAARTRRIAAIVAALAATLVHGGREA